MEPTEVWRESMGSVRDWFNESTGLPGWALTILAIAVGVLILDLISTFILNRLERRLTHSPRRWDDALVHGMRLPLRVWLWVGGLCAFLTQLSQSFDAIEIGRYVGIAFGLLTLGLLFWVEIRLMMRLEQRLIFPPAQSKAHPVDQTSASAITKIVGAITLLTVLLLGMQILGVSVSSILAVGGAGGILLGLAARDVVANFFGGMVVHLDKPFRVGHWIRSPDRDIEGIVEDIGWRMTRIRTFAGPPLYVPNAAFSHIVVETPSRMHSRLLWQTVGIRYQDAHAVEAITKDITAMLDRNEQINKDELITVTLSDYGEHSINLMIYALTETTDWQSFNELKQAVLLGARDIVYSHGAELALPASRLYVPDEVAIRQHRGSGENARCDGESGEAFDSEETDREGDGRDLKSGRNERASSRGEEKRERALESSGQSLQDSDPSGSRAATRRAEATRRGPFDSEQQSESDADG